MPCARTSPCAAPGWPMPCRSRPPRRSKRGAPPRRCVSSIRTSATWRASSPCCSGAERSPLPRPGGWRGPPASTVRARHAAGRPPQTRSGSGSRSFRAMARSTERGNTPGSLHKSPAHRQHNSVSVGTVAASAVRKPRSGWFGASCRLGHADRRRNGRHHAPLAREYGKGWEARFERFDFEPVAAASRVAVRKGEVDGRSEDGGRIPASEKVQGGVEEASARGSVRDSVRGFHGAIVLEPLGGEKRAGTFICAACFLHLFSPEAKFDGGTGWPSFFQALPGRVATKRDFKLPLPRTEYHGTRCGGHRGHVFNDGPPKRNL